MSLDQYVTLGRSGLRVSPLCLGAMTFGEEWGWGASVAESEALIARFMERGGNFIDTANAYTKGHSEAIIGDYLAAAPGRRDRVVVATKFISNLYPGDPNGGGAGRKSIAAHLCVLACGRTAILLALQVRCILAMFRSILSRSSQSAGVSRSHFEMPARCGVTGTISSAV